MPTHYQGSSEERAALDMFIALARGSEAFFARLHECMNRLHLTPSQFGVLETLLHLGPLTPSQIAEKHLKSRNNLSVVIRNLENQGLVTRVRCPKDRRAHWIELTGAGRVLIERAFPEFLKSLIEQTADLTKDEQETLRRLMKKLGRAE